MMKASVLSLLVLFCCANCDDPLPCRFNDGSFGICVDIKSCKSLYGLYRQGTVRVKDLPICDPVKRLVCCPRISSKKCKEYGRNVQEILSSQSKLMRAKCKSSPDILIFGREEAKMHEFPHQALLGYQINDEVKWICGGSLISPEFVLTAANCISSIEYGAVKFVKFGVLDRLIEGSESVFYTVKQTFKYSKDRLLSLQNDIALLKLQGSVKIDEHIFPACLPTRPYYDSTAIETGFGRNGVNFGSLSQGLLVDVVNKFDQEICSNIYSERFNETTMLCYGHHMNRRKSCITDKGGPLQVYNDEVVNCTYTQIGISSFGEDNCGLSGSPNTYVNVYKYIDWIERIVWKDEA